MALGDIGAALIDTLQLRSGTQIIFGDLCHATGDFFAAVYSERLSATVTLDTFEVDDNGNIPATVQDTATVSATGASNGWPNIIKVADGIVAIIHDDDGAGVGPIVRTFPVNALGNIGAEIDTLDLSATTARDSMTIRATQHANLFVGQFYDNLNDLILSTFTIDSSGNISAVLDTETINTDPRIANRPQLVWTGQGDFYAISYTDNASNDGFLQTHTIDSLGNIGAVTDTLEFDTTEGEQISLETNDAGRLTLMYRTDTNNIIIRTVTVDGSGNMTNGATLTSFLNLTQDTDLIRIDEDDKDVFLGVGDENIRSWSIDGAGNPSQIDLLQFVTQLDVSGNVVRKPNNTTIVVLCGHETVFAVDDFFVMSVLVESQDAPAAGGVTSALPNMIQRELLLL